MVSSDTLTRAKTIQQRTGATFHLATRLLPERVRHATYVLYAFFRVADDVVDDPDPPSAAEQRDRLEAMRGAALGEDVALESLASEADAMVLAAFADLRRRHEIPREEVDTFLDAMMRDVDASDFETFEELETYLRGSSVAVGNMMLAVMGASDVEAARPHARALAEAFQLTNFLRDVREDVVKYDRVYVPRESLADHGCSTADVRSLDPSPGLRLTIRDELLRTEERYRRGVAGIEYLPRECQLAVLLAAVLYADHHRLIRAREFDVFTERSTLSLPRRFWLLARTALAWWRSGDPETVFYRVSCIDRSADGEEATGPRSGPHWLPTHVRATVGAPLARIADGVPWRSE